MMIQTEYRTELIMSDKISIIRKLFSDLYVNDSLDEIEESEVDMRRRLKKGHITNDNIIIFRLDQNSKGLDPFPYLKKAEDSGFKGMKRICDFVIFVSNAGDVYALLIEMKKGKDSPVEQLELSVPFLDMVFNRARLLKHWDSSIIIRKIGITDEVGKRTTMDKGEVKYNENNYVKLYKGTTLYLERMLH